MAKIALLEMGYLRNDDVLAIDEFLGEQGARWDTYRNPRPVVWAAVEAADDAPAPTSYNYQPILALAGVTVDPLTGRSVIEHATVAGNVEISKEDDDVVELLGEAVAQREIERGFAPNADRATALVCAVGELACVPEYKEEA
jgi:hypothetical protein